MQYRVDDPKWGFYTLFDTCTGAYFRSDILDEAGLDTGKDPFMASYPHLIDVGIMGHCIHGSTGLCAKAGIGCYQSGPRRQEPNMTLEDFRTIAEQSRGRCNQFALGGRGDPDQHEHFAEILAICRENGLVPNFTTSGYGMSAALAALCKVYCGAVAVSWYRSSYTLSAIELLLQAGVRTNIHYVLGKNTLSEAIDRLRRNDFPRGINAVIFLLHKPVGQGKAENVLQSSDSGLEEFFRELDRVHPFKVGVDSCTVPGVLRHCTAVQPAYLDTCEGGRFSCYIGADMVMVPCSFDAQGQYGVSLRDRSIEEGWNSPQFEAFRNRMRTACPSCEKRELCMGGCPLMGQIVLCDKIEKEKML